MEDVGARGDVDQSLWEPCVIFSLTGADFSTASQRGLARDIFSTQWLHVLGLGVDRWNRRRSWLIILTLCTFEDFLRIYLCLLCLLFYVLSPRCKMSDSGCPRKEFVWISRNFIDVVLCPVPNFVVACPRQYQRIQLQKFTKQDELSVGSTVHAAKQ